MNRVRASHEAGKRKAREIIHENAYESFFKYINEDKKNGKKVIDAFGDFIDETMEDAIYGYMNGFSDKALNSLLDNTKIESITKSLDKETLKQLQQFRYKIKEIIIAKIEGNSIEDDCLEILEEYGLKIIRSYIEGKYKNFIGSAISVEAGTLTGMILNPAGSFIGSAIASIIIDSAYNHLRKLINDYKIVKAERIRIEEECKYLHEQLIVFQERFRATYINNTELLKDKLGASIYDIFEAIKINDVDQFIKSANNVTRDLGGSEDIQFDSVLEFEALIYSNEAFIL